MGNQKRLREPLPVRSFPTNGLPQTTESRVTRGSNKAPKLIANSAASDLAKARELARARAEYDFKSWVRSGTTAQPRRSVADAASDRNGIHGNRKTGVMTSPATTGLSQSAEGSQGAKFRAGGWAHAVASASGYRAPAAGFSSLVNIGTGVSHGSVRSRPQAHPLAVEAAAERSIQVTVGVALIPPPPPSAYQSTFVGTPSILRVASAPPPGIDTLAGLNNIQPATASGTSTASIFSPLGQLFGSKQQGRESSFWSKPAFHFGKESETLQPSPMSRMLGRSAGHRGSPRFSALHAQTQRPDCIATSAPKSSAGLALSCAPMLTPLADVMPYLGKTGRMHDSRSLFS